MFKFSKDQAIRATQDTQLGDVKKGTRGRVVNHRKDDGANLYLVKFRGHDNWVQCTENELEKV